MGSSYSISSEDDVEVSVLESSFTNDEDCLNLEEHKKRNLQNAIDGPTNQILNFTFEAQVQLDLSCVIPVVDFLFKSI
jgi:vacuolar protein sorting-associated protein 13A/C